MTKKPKTCKDCDRWALPVPGIDPSTLRYCTEKRDATKPSSEACANYKPRKTCRTCDHWIPCSNTGWGKTVMQRCEITNSLEYYKSAATCANYTPRERGGRSQ